MSSLRKTYEKEVSARLMQAERSNDIITEKDIAHLPDPVKKYLRYTGVIGKEKVKNFKMTADVQMKMDPNKNWSAFKSEQHNFFADGYTRLFYMETKMFGLPLNGLHTYTHKEARMLIKLAGLITVLDVHGPEMRLGDTTTLFNDMCAFAPATLIDKNIAWEPIDDLSVKASFDAGHAKITATLFFNEEGQLIDFASDDRYYIPMDGVKRKALWSTPLGGYKSYDGYRLPTSGEAVWKFPEGDFCYIKFTNIRVSYNL